MAVSQTGDNVNLLYGLGGERKNLNPATVNAVDSHLMEISSIRLTSSSDSRDSVLAFVRFPKDARLAPACDGKGWEDVFIRMNYEKLMGLGSTKVHEMFTDSAQRRFRRRLPLTTLPPGIEYVLDFTPPQEGPELADLTAALWLPRIIKIWFLAGNYIPEPVVAGEGVWKRPLADRAVGSIMTLGHDDVCKSNSCLTDFSHWQTNENVLGIIDEHPGHPGSRIPDFRKVEDYCPIRHRVSIVRLLRAMNGDGLLLNSAVRMWTVAQVAINLEVPQVVVDPVTQWLVAPPNTKFIEICPEKAFQLAYALKIPSVLIASFKILVNERAVDYASSVPSSRLPEFTWAQRRRDDYGDFPSDPVEYASRSFAERMSTKLRMLQSDQVFIWLPKTISEWNKFVVLGGLIEPTNPWKEAYEELAAALLAVFHQHVQNSLATPAFPISVIDLLEAQRKHYIPWWDRTPITVLYSDLNPSQKALTPFFWKTLKDNIPPLKELSEFTNPNDNMKQKTLMQLVDQFNWHVQVSQAGQRAVPWSSLPSSSHFFSLARFRDELRIGVGELANSVTGGQLAALNEHEGAIPFYLSDHLLLNALDESEMKYLPLWADGLDDGSGGVFQEPVPLAEMGPSEPGPGYHTGFTVPSYGGTAADTETLEGGSRAGGYASTVAQSSVGIDMGVLALDDESYFGGGTAAGKSMLAQRSATPTATADGNSVVDGGGVHPAPPPSESFAADSREDDDYADAMFAQPADHQVHGMAIERYMEEEDMQEQRDAMDLDDNYADDMDDMGFYDSDDGSSTLDGFEEIDADADGDANASGRI